PVVRNVVQPQDEAIVDIPDTELVLLDLVGIEIVANRPCRDPVRRNFIRNLAQDALAAVQEPDEWLRGIVSVQHRHHPAIVIGSGLSLKPLYREARLIEAVTGDEAVGSVRLECDSGNVVRTARIESAL